MLGLADCDVCLMFVIITDYCVICTHLSVLSKTSAYALNNFGLQMFLFEDAFWL